MQKLQTKDIVQILKAGFESENMYRFFQVAENFSYEGEKMMLGKDNSLLLNFKENDGNYSYRLLLILELFNKTDFDVKINQDLLKIKDKNVDKIAILSLSKPTDEQIQVLKPLHVTIIFISPNQLNDKSIIRNFYPISTNDNEYSVYANKVADNLTKRLKKLFHIVLSEIAADKYDEEYGSDSNLGTKAIMDFEEEIIDGLVSEYKSRKKGNEKLIAVDVGCGTGRHSFIVSKDFDTVYGFDFSPQMIEIAKQKKAKDKKYDNCIFCEADMEYENIRYELDFSGKADFVIASFGMGSFVEDTNEMLLRFNDWLKPGGRIIISFYNKESILFNVTPNWRDTSLSAHLDIENNTLQVQLNPETIFQIFCQPFDVRIESLLKSIYNEIDLFFYPTTISLLPNSLLQNEKAMDIFKTIDIDIANNPFFRNGHYVLFCGEKITSERKKTSYDITKSYLKERKVSYEEIEHSKIITIEDAKSVLSLQSYNSMVKTLLLTLVIKTEEKNTPNKKDYIIVCLRGDKKLNKIKLLSHLNATIYKNTNHKLNDLKFASEKELVKLGCQLGGISPFGFPKDIKAKRILDNDLIKSDKKDLFMGIGINNKTLKMKKIDFIKLTSRYSKIKTIANNV